MALTYFADDLDLFFDDETHAVSCTYTPQGGSASTFNVIFNNEYYAIDGGEVGVESTEPTVTTKTSNISGASHGDTMVIDSVTYKIINIRPDNTGMTEIGLEKQ
jgi:hypothetical protein